MSDDDSLSVGKESSFRDFLWDPEKREFLGRTGTSWAKIGIFYVIFYSFLAGFFAIMLTVFYQTVDVQYKPKYIPGDGSSVLRNPALGFRPMPPRSNVESTLIWYTSSDEADIHYWVQDLNNFIAPYEGTTDTSGQHMTECSETNLPEEGKEVCNFDDEWLGPACQKAEYWGYRRNSPCIILKLNKMFGWKPEVYDTLEELPSNMPKDLREHIENLTHANNNVIPRYIWVSCQGENPADMEYITKINYYPWRGFPAYYFPFTNTAGYRSPVVAVEIVEPQANVLINIECRAWAKNIIHDRGNRLGLVHFELLKD